MNRRRDDELALLQHAVAACEARRRKLNTAPLDTLAEAKHITATVADLAATLDTIEPGLGVRLVTALYVQVHETRVAYIDGVVNGHAAPTAH